MIIYWIILFFSAFSSAEPPAQKSNLSPDLQKFLGPPSPNFQKEYLEPAKLFRKALELKAKKKNKEAIEKLSNLTKFSSIEDHVRYEILLLQKEKKDWEKALQQADTLLKKFPSFPFKDEVEKEAKEFRCEIAEKNLSSSKGKATEQEAYLCLSTMSWKDWSKRENLIEALYSRWKSSKSEFFEPFAAEIVQALPATAKIRLMVQKDFKDPQLKNIGALARYKSNVTSYPGIRPTYQDLELFNKALSLAMNSNWSDAKENWKLMLKDHPLSEHSDRAQYWVARSELALGNDEEAKKLFSQIADSSPITYYGLQSTLWLKRDILSLLKPSSSSAETIEAFKGGILPAQWKSLQRLRAFLELDLRNQAEEEARFLFQNRTSGSTLGQDSASGASKIAKLYSMAGFHMGSFSHAYAATTLDGNYFNRENLSYIFPKPFWDHYLEVSKASNVNALLLASISKQESAFWAKAISRANALGLMQLLHSTAKDLSPKVTIEELYDPRTNIELGTKYIAKLLERFKSIPLALAAYNAGPSRAAAWERTFIESNAGKKPFDLDFFMESIPFTETRKYVAAIMRNYTWYMVLENGVKIERIEELTTQWQNPKPEINLTPLEPNLPQPTSL